MSEIESFAMSEEVPKSVESGQEGMVMLERFRGVIQALGQIVYDWKPLVDEVVWEGDYTGILGYTKEEMGTDTARWIHRIHADDFDRVMAEVDCATRERRNYDLVYRFCDKWGTYHWMHDRGVTFVNAQGQLERIIGVFIDITSTKDAEEELRASENKFRSITQNAADYIFIKDSHRRYCFINKAMEQLLGCTESEILGKTSQDVFGDEQSKIINQVDDRTFAGEVVNEIKSLIIVGQEFHFHTVQTPLTYEDGTVTSIMGIVRDITKRKKIEEQSQAYQHRLKRLTSELTLAEERLKKVLAVQLHDNICQELAMMRVEVARLGKDVNDQGVRSRLEAIYDSIEHVIDQAQNITTELSYPALTLLGLDEAIRKWAETEITVKYGIRVDVQDDGESKPLSEDVQAVLFRGVRELLTNVVKHAGAKNVLVRIDRQGKDVMVRVRDDGVGMDFDQEADNTGSGFGILSVAEAIEGLGGRLEYESNSKQGCCAKITAPLVNHLVE